MEEYTPEELAELEKELLQLQKENPYYGYPEPLDKETIFKFFRELLNLKDTSKTGNLSEGELGVTRLSVRSYQELGLYADAEGLSDVADYFKKKGEIVLATSSSRKGFLSSLFVTQIKKEQKITQPSIKRTWWGGSKQVGGEGEGG